MVKIRLTRTGRKNAPSYRIVVTDSRSKRDGKFIEIIGSYNPTENPDNFIIKQDRYDHWTSVGAQTSSAVKKLIAGDYKYVAYDPNAETEEAEEIVEDIVEEAVVEEVIKEEKKEEEAPEKKEPEKKPESE